MTPADTPADPLACKLSPNTFRDRSARIDAILQHGLEEVVAVPGGVRARFLPSAGPESELQALVELEAECCSFLAMTLRSDVGGLVLEVTGAPQAQSLIEELFTDRTSASG